MPDLSSQIIHPTESTKPSRRQLLKLLAATGGSVALSPALPRTWTQPVIEVGLLPAHAQTSAPVVNTPTPVASTPTIEEIVCPGQPVSSQITTLISAVPNKADILFAFDTTASMGSVLSQAKSEATKILNELATLIPDARFGVVDFRDYQIFSSVSVDYPYQLHQSITADRDVVVQAINSLSLGGGGDGPEAYSRALFESYSDSTLNFRSDSRKIVIMFGDNFPHDDNLNEGVPMPPFNPGGVYCGGAPCVLDPGRDAQQNTADDLNLQTVLQEMAANQITLLFISSSFGESNLVYWSYWAGLTNSGGQAVSLGNVENLATVILDLVGSAGQKIGQLSLSVTPAEFASWLTAAEEATDLSIPEEGLTVDLDFTVTPPPDTDRGVYDFFINMVGDGVIYSETTTRITVPVDC